ncbi:MULTISPECIES: ABC transporter substrate-binding protein [Pseudonocardia]|uniref:FeIII-dicitrate-binding periplasmic lipoprotein n=2 Tax=Pseudonocardia TaxID=1847 RepID=A0ABQ0RUE4_9PSEU|nr:MULTISPECIES: ABC transporter substrate-binding protein [Pseudonocardia]OSY41299.1 putative siderophore-binding lipoprotein YfiY precursor [Pseudonocardia autotrophica]TDN76755.1 ABC-type Fe3+-hydroxamate transport system substrate-binding protein [Pseudonocardia autotrophica]BBG00756.1 putative FeIII-dicitrate-binding periplasmic lipoprotein [Pseudonocardia autotrophica]GEC24278.1 putative FeIII-dicitrate-binding periplasmic lipoprotein [Pseudonocardia saturnea]
MRPLPRAAAALALLLLAGCSGGTVAAEPQPGGTRTVAHERGTVEVPADARSVVALDEYAGLNLLTVGIRPAAVFGGLSSELGTTVLGDAGVGVTPAPTMITSPDLEAIAATGPDVIVLTSPGSLLDTTYPQLSAIAPTVVLPFEGDWREPVRVAGAAFGAEDRAGAVVGVLEDRLAELREATGRQPLQLSVLGSFQDMLYSPAPANPGSRLVADAGITRPEAELAAAAGASASTIPVSAEMLPAHDADAVVVLGGSIYDSEAVTGLPTFAALHAARAGRTTVAVGEMWAGGTALATWWVLDDLTTLTGGGLTLGTVDDGPARAAALQAAADDAS